MPAQSTRRGHVVHCAEWEASGGVASISAHQHFWRPFPLHEFASEGAADGAVEQVVAGRHPGHYCGWERGSERGPRRAWCHDVHRQGKA